MEKKYQVYRFVHENPYQRSIKELSIKTEYVEGASFADITGMFRQFLVMLGYSEDAAKLFIRLDESDLEALGMKMSDLSFYTE